MTTTSPSIALAPLMLVAACAMGDVDELSRSSSEEQTLGDEATTTATSGADETSPSGDDGTTSDSAGDSGTEPNPNPVVVSSILKTNCSQCHGADSQAAGNIDYITDLATLVEKGTVVPGDPEGSKLYVRLSTGTMPPAGVEQRPSEADIETIYAWIKAGAPPGPPAPNCVGQFLGNDDMFSAMRKDVIDLPVGDLKFTRYLTITHIYNSGVCDDQLDVYRQAVAKGVNSLSNKNEIGVPVAIQGAEGTIFRIDIRDYGWDENPIVGDVWEAIAEQNKFAIRFLGDLAEPLRIDLQTEVPNQPADSFFQLATRGQFYYDILEIPATLAALQARLGVDVQANINDGDMLRAAFLNSGVSQFNRVFDRHPLSGSRYYYESSDFTTNAGTSNVFVHPLDFKRAGGEMIFSLANGFQGYAIEVDGKIVPEAATTIVKDPLQPDSVVRAGISCMGCHQAGIIPRDDDFLAYFKDHKSDFNAERTIIEEIFLPEEMHEKQAADIAEFAAVLKTVDIPTTGSEPMITTSLAFETDLNLQRAAAELGVTPETLAQELAGLDPQLNRLDGGTISRDVFEDVFAATTCLLIPGDNAFPDCFDAG